MFNEIEVNQRLYLVVEPVPPGNAPRFLKVHIPVTGNPPADSLQIRDG